MGFKRFKNFLVEGQMNSATAEFAKHLEELGYKVNRTHSKAQGYNIVLNPVHGGREDEYAALIKSLPEYDPQRVFKKNLSSDDILALNNGIKIIVKDPGKQTSNKKSNQNEIWFVEQINQIAENGPFTLKIQSTTKPDHIVILKGVTSAYQTNTANALTKEKADIKIEYAKGIFNLSIKALKADFYASLVTDKNAEEIGTQALNYALKNKITSLVPHPKIPDEQSITKALAVKNIDEDLLQHWMFGDDIKGNGAIISYDSHRTNFVREKNGYSVQVKFIVESEHDITIENLGNYYPVMMILSHSGKRLGKIKGINARLATLTRAKSALMLDYNDII